MFLFLVSSLPLLLLLCSLPMKPLPPWADESRLLSFMFLREIARFCVQWLKARRMLTAHFFKIQSSMSVRKDSAVHAVESMGEMNILDLPELALECVLSKLSPAGLADMACVCSSLRDRCRSDHLWGRHMREKWDGVIGPAAKREWEWYLSSRKEFLRGFVGSAKQEGWMGSLSFMWPLTWLKTKIDGVAENGCPIQVNSIMSCYRALESGRFWFPAQVYNRENGHVGFMLSCYDAEVSYDCRTDTFHARYPPHGRRAMNIEEGVKWERLRAPPIDTPAHDLHVSDSLSDLHPGDHIEIQWRKNREFPYGWWYGVVGHLELCDRSGHHCRCHNSDTVVLEFNHYTSDSRWRRTVVNRMDHKEEGNESNGFYGGIRKLYRKDEISTWTQMWPSEVLE